MRVIVLLCLASAAAAASAQHHGYAAQASADIKALTASEIEQYRAGAGMGYAKAAELNHFPGPMHALELADAIGLSAEQRQAAQALMDRHKAEARALGARIVQSESELDALFRAGGVDEAALARLVRAAAALEGEYRLAHLETHRRMRALLTPQQVTRYDELRGYRAGHGGHRH
jgi:Spy/CpxP family protein refolding chaperone